MEGFKRIGSLVWRGLFATLFVWLGLTRFADVLWPSARTDWVDFCARHSIFYGQVLFAQLATVGLSGWLVWTLANNARFAAAWPKIEFLAAVFSSKHLTWGVYRTKHKLVVGGMSPDLGGNLMFEFWVALFALVLCLGMNPAIEFIFREKKVKEA